MVPVRRPLRELRMAEGRDGFSGEAVHDVGEESLKPAAGGDGFDLGEVALGQGTDDLKVVGEIGEYRFREKVIARPGYRGVGRRGLSDRVEEQPGIVFAFGEE